MIIDDLSEKLRDSAQNLLKETPQGERITWVRHPLTQALLKELQACTLDYHSAWEAGDFASESAEGTAQLSARATGALQFADQILEYMNQIPLPLEDEDDQTEGA